MEAVKVPGAAAHPVSVRDSVPLVEVEDLFSLESGSAWIGSAQGVTIGSISCPAGAVGLELAHRISPLGSEAATRLLPERDRIPVMALGAGHLTAMSMAFAPVLSSTFMYQYGWYWTGRGVVGDGWEQAMADAKARPEAIRVDAVRAVDVAQRVVDDERTGPVLAEYAAAVRAQVDDLRPEMWNHSIALVVHHHMHLMNNRLGVLPLQEAHLARMLYLGTRLQEQALARRRARADAACAASAPALATGAPAAVEGAA